MSGSGQIAGLNDADITDLLGYHRVDPATGLAEAEVSRRLESVGRNELPRPRRRPLLLRLFDQLREPMNLLLIVAAGVSGLALGERLDAVAIGAIVVLNAVIALVQEGRADQALAALEQLSTPQATVLRGAATKRVPASEVVPGDIVRVEAGDGVPADVRLIESTLLEVDESMLTGESMVVAKTVPVAARRDDPVGQTEEADRLFWGTFVTRGSGTGLVVSTGSATKLGLIAASLNIPSPPTPLQVELGRLSSRLGVAAVVIAAALFAITLIRLGATVEGLERAFVFAVALAIAAVPEGLPTVTLVGLAVGVRRMAQHGAIVRRLPAVETLGSASVIVTDKTGTITENRMAVTSVWTHETKTVVPDAWSGELAGRGRRIAALASDAFLESAIGDPMELALLRFVGVDRVSALRAEMPRAGVWPFDGERMRMSSVNQGEDGFLILTKGAPESLMEICTTRLDSDGLVRPLTDEDRLQARVAAEEMASAGLRVLALAESTRSEVPARADEAERDLMFVALLGMKDPVRKGAAAAVSESIAAGVRLVMATGDHPSTAVAIGREVGLDTTRPPVTGADLKTGGGIPSDPLAVSIYARMEPAQKLDLVQALQERGEVVAMTGDGVNDAPALRTADIGVALGERGSDVAREAADMVVTDDDLATIVTATRVGRGIYDNIRKVVDYLVAGNLSEIGVVVGALFLMPGLGVPLLPLQLLWINLLTDGLPALALGNDRHDPGLMHQPPRPRTAHLLGRHRLIHLTVRGGLMATACLATGLMASTLNGDDPDHIRTVLLTTLVLIHLLYAFVARQPAKASLHDPMAKAGWLGTRWLVAAVAGGLGLQFLIVTWSPAQAVFGTTTLSGADWVLVMAGAAAGLVVTVIHRRVGGGSEGREEMQRHT